MKIDQRLNIFQWVFWQTNVRKNGCGKYDDIKTGENLGFRIQ